MTVDRTGTTAASANRAGSAPQKVGAEQARELVSGIRSRHRSNAEKLQLLDTAIATNTFTADGKKIAEAARSELQAAIAGKSDPPAAPKAGPEATAPKAEPAAEPPPSAAKAKAPGPHRPAADDFSAVYAAAQKASASVDEQLRPALHGTLNSVLTALDEGERPPLNILGGAVKDFLAHPTQLSTFRAALPVLGELGRLSLPDPRVHGQLMGIAEKHGGEDGKQLMGAALEGIQSRRGFAHTVTEVALTAAKFASRFAETAAKGTPYAAVATVARQAIDFLDADGVERIGAAVKRLVDTVKHSDNKVDIAVNSANLVASVVGTVPRFHWVPAQSEHFLGMYDGFRAQSGAKDSTQVNWDEI